jgi:hypothetical protein
VYTLLATGDVPGASTYFNPLLQQSTISCTSSSRPASPPDGMRIYETDTKLFRSYSSALSLWLVEGASGVFTYTPTLTATTTSPNLGSGSVVRGKYTRGAGGMVHVAWRIAFGTTGTASGTGQYLVSLPIAAAVDFGGSDPEWWGQGRITDQGSNTYPVTWYIPGSNPSVVSAVMFTSAGGGQVWSSTSFTVNASDDCAGSITYRAAAGS